MGDRSRAVRFAPITSEGLPSAIRELAEFLQRLSGEGANSLSQLKAIISAGDIASLSKDDLGNDFAFVVCEMLFF